jgi:hypothetical protein
MSTEDRLRKLEAAIKTKGCATCRDWPLFEDFVADFTPSGGSPAPPRQYPEACPDCGRQGPSRFVFTVVPARGAV